MSNFKYPFVAGAKYNEAIHLPNVFRAPNSLILLISDGLVVGSGIFSCSDAPKSS